MHSARGSTIHVAPGELTQVDECRMADPLYQDDEMFHLLRLGNYFWLLGPMVDGAGRAMDRIGVEAPKLRKMYEIEIDAMAAK